MSHLFTKTAALRELADARRSPGLTRWVQGWGLTATRCYTRGAGPAWKWNYSIEHSVYRPHGGSFDSANEAARCVAGLGVHRRPELQDFDGSNLERCWRCCEQYCDAMEDDQPVHTECVRRRVQGACGADHG